MKLLKRIMVATDFSRHSRDALRMAILLAEPAIAPFEYCLRSDVLFIPAWEGLAAAYRQKGRKR